MTLQHPMDSHRPNEFLEDIMSEEELEQHNKELRALQARNAKHGMAVTRAKFAKFDRFEELVTKHEELNFQLLKAYDLNVNDAVSIAYSIIGHFAFGGDDNLEGHIYYSSLDPVDEPLMTSIRKVSKKYDYGYLEEAMIVAFSKFRGGKLNRRVKKLAEFLKNLDKSDKLDIRSFYAENNASSDWVSMIHKLICAYKFDNQDNENLQRPLMFDYDARSSKVKDFYEFFMTASWSLNNFRDGQELINALIKNGYYHYSEIEMIGAFTETEYEDVFKRIRIFDKID